MIRFLDANPFVYAFLRGKKRLKPSDRRIKEAANGIIQRVDEGHERAVTSVVHLSEVANILEARTGKGFASQFMMDILNKESVTVLDVSVEEYSKAADIAVELGVGVNDALILVLVEPLGITEVYSFDQGIDTLGLTRIMT